MKTLDEVAKESANEIWCDDTTLENEQRELHGHFCGYTTAIESDYNKSLQIESQIKVLEQVRTILFDKGTSSSEWDYIITDLQEQLKQLQP